MRVSQRAQYAVRAVVDIAHTAEERPAQLRDVARRQAVPAAFLERICRQLCRAGILVGRRGPRGGYRIALPPAEVTVGDVYRAIEGQRAFRLAAPERGAARRVSEGLWADLAGVVARRLDGITVADLCERAHRSGVPRRGARPYTYAI